MAIEFLLERFADNEGEDAIVWRDKPFSYRWLAARVVQWRERFEKDGLHDGSVVGIEGDFSPNGCALFLALVEAQCVVVPLTVTIAEKRAEFLETAQVEATYHIDSADAGHYRNLKTVADNEYYQLLRERQHPGLVLFSSGSTGRSKAAVHDFVPLLDKFRPPRKRLRAITFLLYDHIGGVNTMLYTLSNGGCVVTVQKRTPHAVLSAVARHKVQLLPTTPTFLNLILLSEVWQHHDLSCLQTVTYGTEPMAESTLKAFHQVVPHVKLQQTYGLSEIGILRSKSRSSDSLWVKIGGEGFETRVVEGILHVKANSAMLGYLNSPSPFTEDGWLNTGDCVETDGDYLRFLGRRSELINVGGEKVWPREVEDVIGEMPEVAEVVVYGEQNLIVGQIVCAKVTLNDRSEQDGFPTRLKRFCRTRLQPYKVPVKVVVADGPLHSDRFKKQRR